MQPRGYSHFGAKWWLTRRSIRPRGYTQLWWQTKQSIQPSTICKIIPKLSYNMMFEWHKLTITRPCKIKRAKRSIENSFIKPKGQCRAIS